jgi:hypothetical protein
VMGEDCSLQCFAEFFEAICWPPSSVAIAGFSLFRMMCVRDSPGAAERRGWLDMAAVVCLYRMRKSSTARSDVAFELWTRRNSCELKE